METSTFLSDVAPTNVSMGDGPFELTAERIIEASILCVISGLAFSGNVCVWIVILGDAKLRNNSNILLLCLSAADILLSFTAMPVTVYTILRGEWVFSQQGCVVLGFTTMVTLVASVLSLGLISINRYILICHHHCFRKVYTRCNVAMMIIGILAFSAALAVPPLLGWAVYDYLPGQSFCFCNWKTSISYTYFMVAACFGGPCAVMTFCYIQILREFRASKTRMAEAEEQNRLGSMPRRHRDKHDDQAATKSFNAGPGTPSKDRDPTMSSDDVAGTPSMATSNTELCEDVDFSLPSNTIATPSKVNLHNGIQTKSELDTKYEENRKQKQKRKRQEELTLAMSFMVIVLVFVVCWLPFCVTMFWSVYSPSPVPRILDMATLLLGYFNSCCNPFLYGLMNKKLRAAYHKLFCSKCSCTKSKRNGHADTSNVRSSSTMS